MPRQPDPTQLAKLRLLLTTPDADGLLPTFQSVAEQLGVSRQAVWKAARRLKIEGRLAGWRGRAGKLRGKRRWFRRPAVGAKKEEEEKPDGK